MQREVLVPYLAPDDMYGKRDPQYSWEGVAFLGPHWPLLMSCGGRGGSACQRSSTWLPLTQCGGGGCLALHESFILYTPPTKERKGCFVTVRRRMSTDTIGRGCWWTYNRDEVLASYSTFFDTSPEAALGSLSTASWAWQPTLPIQWFLVRVGIGPPCHLCSAAAEKLLSYCLWAASFLVVCLHILFVCLHTVTLLGCQLLKLHAWDKKKGKPRELRTLLLLGSHII